MARDLNVSERFIEQFSQVKKRAALISRMLSQPDKEWNTTQDVAANLRRLLSIWYQFTKLRGEWISLCSTVSCDIDYLKDAFEPYPQRVSVGTYGTGWNQGRCSHHSIRATEMKPDMPTVEQFTIHRQASNRTTELAAYLDCLFAQFKQLHDSRPEYMEIKRLLPLNGRAALSILKVCDQGRLDRNIPHQHELFGFTIDPSGFSQVIKIQMRLINPRKVEKNGRAPSFAAGCDLSGELPFNSRNRYDHDSTLKDRLCRWNSAINPRFVIGRERLVSSPTFYLLCQREGYRHANRFAARLGVTSCSFTTILTARPAHISGDDYVAPAVWVENNQRHSWRTDYASRKGQRELVRGFVYFRKGWNECFHSREELSAADATRQLDESSRWYFERREQEAKRKELARLTTRQRQARIIRRLRSIPAVLIDDSYAVGNCQPGTKHFLQLLGISSESIPGRELAKLWRSHNYPDFSRFEPVATAAEKRIAQLKSDFYTWGCQQA